MGNGVVKGTKTLGPVWAGSERSGGERSEPPRSGEPAQTAARQAGRVGRGERGARHVSFVGAFRCLFYCAGAK